MATKKEPLPPPDTPSLDTVRRIDFERLGAVVGERIRVLALYVQNIEKTTNASAEVNEAICRDLVLPCVGLLTDFLQAVQVHEGEA